MLHEYDDQSYHDYHYLRFTATAPTELATDTAVATAIASRRQMLSSLHLYKLRLERLHLLVQAAPLQTETSRLAT